MHAESAKAGHLRRAQTEWSYSIGALKCALYAARDGSPTQGTLLEFHSGDRYSAACLRIPPGVTHGGRAFEQTHLSYMMSSVYNPDNMFRIAHDDPTIGHDLT